MTAHRTAVLLSLTPAAMLAACISTAARKATERAAAEAPNLEAAGPALEGTLDPGSHAQLPLALESGRCCVVAAAGGDGLRQLALELSDPAGFVVAEAPADAAPLLHYCPTVDGTHTLALRPLDGAGRFAVVQRQGPAEAPSTPASPTAAAPETEPTPLRAGAAVRGSGPEGLQGLPPTCSPGDPLALHDNRTYRIELRRSGRLSVRLDDLPGAGIELAPVAPPSRTAACAVAPTGATSPSAAFELLLGGGAYLLTVSVPENTQGEYRLTTAFEPTGPLPDSLCAALPPLPTAGEVSGTARGVADGFPLGFDTAGELWRLDLQTPARLGLQTELDSPNTLELLADCDPLREPLERAAGGADEPTSLGRRLDPGSYVVALAASHAAGKPFRLAARLVPEDAPPGVPGDSCADPEPLAPDAELPLDFLNAKDDLELPGPTGTGTPDLVRQVALPTAGLLSLQPDGDRTLAFAVRAACDDPTTELAHGRNTPYEPWTVPLPAGTWNLLIEPTETRFAGQVTVLAQLEPLPETLTDACDEPALQPIERLTGTTHADSRRSTAYSLDLAERSTVELSSESAFAVAYSLRRRCLDASSELAASGSGGMAQGWSPTPWRTRLSALLDAGRYVLLVIPGGADWGADPPAYGDQLRVVLTVTPQPAP